MKQEFCARVQQVKEDFRECGGLLRAIGDENRQHILCVMMELPVDGARVVEIAARTHLSRPAVSHHMQILREAGVVCARKQGTFVYYYYDPDACRIDRLETLIHKVTALVNELPHRDEEGLPL